MRVAILGTGLIGGSIGLAARRRAGAHVTGHDPDPSAVREGVAAGALDAGATDVATAVADAEVVVVCAPVGEIARVAGEALAAAGPDAVVTDVGSAKRPIVAAIADRRFVGGHPLAGAETAGIANARADLLDGATWYLTPRTDTPGVLYDRLQRFVAALGARPQAIDAADHDRAMAVVSHLPHVVANVLASQAADVLGAAGTPPALGPSLRDATRVAGANTTMWTDIYLANRTALGEEIDGAIARLQAFRARLDDGDAAAIAAWNDAARDDRDALRDAGTSGGPLTHLSVPVADRPGVVADIALSLGRAGINIHDMTLSPSPTDRTGEVSLWVAADRADEASALLRGLDLRGEGR